MDASPLSKAPLSLGRIKLKYLILFILAALAWSSVYAPASMSLLLAINLFALLLLNFARFKYLPKARLARSLGLVEKAPNDSAKVRAVIICDGESKETVLASLQSLENQSYKNLETIILKVGKYDNVYEGLKEYCDKRSQDFKLFRKEGPLPRGEALASCIDHGPQDFENVLIISSGLKLSPHILDLAMNSLQAKQADYLQFSPQAQKQSIFEKKRTGFFKTYMRASPSCASPGIMAPMVLLRKAAIPNSGSWRRENSPFLSLSISLIKNRRRGFFEASACGSAEGALRPDIRQSLYEVKLGDILQIGAPRFIPLLLQLTSHFHFIAIPTLYFVLRSLELLFDFEFAPREDHCAFLAGSAVILSLYFKLALIYQKHYEHLPIWGIIRNYLLEMGSAFHANGIFKGSMVGLLLFTTMLTGGALFHATHNVSFLAPIVAGLLVLSGLLAFLKENKEGAPINRRPQQKDASGKNKRVWGVQMNSSEA